MNTPNTNIPEVKSDESVVDTNMALEYVEQPADAAPSSTEQWPFNNTPPVVDCFGRTGDVILTEADIQPEVKEPTLEEVQAAAIARAGSLFNIEPLTSGELKHLADLNAATPQDWAESLTQLRLALRDLDDAIPTKNRARTEGAFVRLQKHAKELGDFLRLRGLKVD